MRLTNRLIDKFGVDKLLHFLVGAWITAIAVWFGWWGVVSGLLITAVVSIVKELLDESFDWHDIMAAIYGCLITIVIFTIFKL